MIVRGTSRALLYVVAQSAGSVCGAAILKAVLPSVELSNTVPGPAVAIWSVFIIELIITFVLVLTVFATCDSLRPGIGGSGPLAAGLAVSMCNLWAVRSRFHLRLLHVTSLIRSISEVYKKPSCRWDSRPYCITAPSGSRDVIGHVTI